ncbi:MAG: YigZ family protein [Acidobacteriota bacterium]
MTAADGDLPAGGYHALATYREDEMRERRSRFLAIAEPVQDREGAVQILRQLRERYDGANHVCWGLRIGPRPEEGFSDDGEPRGTAGLPILQALRGAELSDALVAVVRWFGGIKLGKGGLVRAYGDAARLVIHGAPRIARIPRRRLVVQLPYEQLGAVKRCLRPPQIELADENYGERVTLALDVHPGSLDSLHNHLAALGLTALESETEDSSSS